MSKYQCDLALFDNEHLFFHFRLRRMWLRFLYIKLHILIADSGLFPNTSDASDEYGEVRCWQPV